MMQTDQSSTNSVVVTLDNENQNFGETWPYEDEEEEDRTKDIPIQKAADLQELLWNYLPTRIDYDPDGVDKFFDLVRAMNLRPIRKMRQMLVSEIIDLEYYGFNCRIVKAICAALEKNTYVKCLNLKGNILCPDACYHLNDLLLNNSTLTCLNLSGCKIGSEGSKYLNIGLIRNTSLTELNLDNCNLCDEGMIELSEVIEENASILTLSLSNNNITDNCAERLCSMVFYNFSIQSLNLSYNKLSSVETYEMIVKALIENQIIREIDLSWNPVTSENTADVMTIICSFLEKNSNLETLKLRYNKFNERDAEMLGKALSNNTNLKKLYLGGNPLTPVGALKIIEDLVNAPESSLELLELSNIWVNKKKPWFMDIENNIIKKDDFEEVLKYDKNKFSSEALITEILETIPRNDPVTTEDIKKIYDKKTKKASKKKGKKRK